METAPLFNVAVPNGRLPYLKVTSPVGVPCAAVTVAVNTAGCPTIDGFGWDCSVVVVASRPAIVVVTLAVVGGNPIARSWSAVASAVLVSVPRAAGDTTICALPATPAGKAPNAHTTTLPAAQLFETEMRFTLAGNTSVTITSVASAGPALVTTSVYVNGSPRSAKRGADFVSTRSSKALSYAPTSKPAPWGRVLPSRSLVTPASIAVSSAILLPR